MKFSNNESTVTNGEKITSLVSISVSPTDEVLHTAREKEKNYTSDQNDPEVVQPYAAYSPAGNPKVNCCIATTDHAQKLSFFLPSVP